MVQKLPAPMLMVFYNGTASQADRIEYKLSDAYINEVTEPNLELKVTILNVNDGHNEELMKHCPTLKEYAQYVAKVRRYAAEMSLEAAVKRAIDDSITEGILEDFLQKNCAEVEMTSIFEYDKEEEEKKLCRAEYELGVEDEREETKKETAVVLAGMGMPVKDIAQVVKESIECVQEWAMQQRTI